MVTVRAVLALASQNMWSIYQMDVVITFLQGSLEEEVYMKVPQGFTTEKRLVCRLHKSLYGLKE